MTDAFTELVAWFVTEGHSLVDERLSVRAASRWRVCIDQSHEVNAKNCDRIRVCLSNVGVEWRECHRAHGMSRFLFFGPAAKAIHEEFAGKRLNDHFINSLTR